MDESSISAKDKSNEVNGDIVSGKYQPSLEAEQGKEWNSPPSNVTHYQRIPGEEDAHEMKFLEATTKPKSMQVSVSVEDLGNKTGQVSLSRDETFVEMEESHAVDINHPNAPSNIVTKSIDRVDRRLKDLCRKYRSTLLYLLYATLLVAYVVYFAIAVSRDFNRAIALVAMTIFAVVLVVYKSIVKHFGQTLRRTILLPCFKFCKTKWRIVKWLLYLSLLIAFLVFAGFLGVFHSLVRTPKQLTSALGILVFVLLSLICSKRPGWVQWRAVFWGIALQFLLGVLILRTSAGFSSFRWLGDEVSTFLGYADRGAEFVFSAPLEVHFFVFKVLPSIIFFSYILAMLYYLGVMQWITQIFAVVMQHTMGTSGAESLCAAANIFTGLTTAPLVIKPYLKDMTASELHSILTSGYATIAGGVLGAYIAFGISASHLLSASIISAPAALAVSKIFYPELGRPKTLNSSDTYKTARTERNILEAAANGASDGLKVCVNVTGQLIAIISALAFIDAVLSWIGGMVDHPELTFTLICRYVLYPVAWLMGVDSEDCHIVAELVGIKTFLNEFVAYSRLAEYIKNRSTGFGPTISVRSEVIATYALCGFANFGGVAIYIGGLSPLLPPHRKGEVAILSLKSLLAGSVACLMTACVAGVLYDESGPKFFESLPDVTTNITALDIVNSTYTY
ncbi:solute carrier family 28 member 3-like [Ptychodera flava]|uniref:solute carrier family 28 member 3-like n=1 Tax=Ptychodera flava TaxID=63121 RepID=UPI00396A7E4E